MRVLFVSHSFFPNGRKVGIYNRMLMFLEALKEVEHLDMLFYVSPETDISLSNIAELEFSLRRSWHARLNLFLCPRVVVNGSFSKYKHLASGVVNFFKQPDVVAATGTRQLEAFEACLERQPDAIFAHRLPSMCPALLTQKQLPPIFFDLDDIEHRKLMRCVRQPPHSLLTNLYYLLVPKLLQGECKAIRLADLTFVCSDHDQHYLKNTWHLPKVVTIPNAVSIPQPQPISSEPTLLFLGNYSYLPNANAANLLIDKIFPGIRSIKPEARLIIAGDSPQNIQSYDRNVPGVEFTGFVENLEALYRQVRVVCCPIFAGGGTRVKLIEAAAYGKPFVSTRIGAEGLDMKDGQEFLQRDSTDSFVEACLELLNNYTLCEQLGAAARVKAIQRYDISNIVKLVQQCIFI